MARAPYSRADLAAWRDQERRRERARLTIIIILAIVAFVAGGLSA